jgi:hypothetical protein
MPRIGSAVSYQIAFASFSAALTLSCSRPRQYPYGERPYTMSDGSPRQARVRVHPDRRVQVVVEQIREAETLHAIDRLRLIHSTREKTVVILCNRIITTSWCLNSSVPRMLPKWATSAPA